MAQYLDKAGLDALWKKIKGTFVAKTIKKSDSSNATQITHDGDTVSLSRGIISGTGNTSTYIKESSIDIIGNDIIFTAINRPRFKTSSDGTPVNLVLKSDLIIAGTNDLGLVRSTTTGKTANRDYYVEVDPEYGRMKVNVPWTDTNTTYTFNGAVSTIKDNNLTPSKVLISNSDGKVAVSNISSTELSYLKGANENIQNRLNTLTSYFNADGIAICAMGDENGKNIVNTYATKNELNTFKNLKGQKNGLAELDSNGKVPSSQLPSYVDDVIEGYYYNSKFYKEESHTNEITGESGKIYTDIKTNKTYRWSGTAYTEISASLALGETSSTAYPGNKGAANASNIKTLQGYFSSGVAKQAAADGNGNNIINTYAKKSDLASVAQRIIDTSILTTKGDIIYASEAETPTRLGIGANGKVLKVVSGVPAWSDDNNTTYSAGNGISLNGTIFSLNTNYENNGRNYAVLVDSNKNLYVNVPWNDTNTTYSAGTGLSLSGTIFSVKTGYSANGKNYAIKADTNGNLYVNVPWVNTTDHSHSNKALLDSFEGAIPDSAINALS